MKPVIIRNIERPDEGLVRKLGEFGVATVHEAQGRTGLMLPYMRPVYLGAHLAGPAVTVYSTGHRHEIRINRRYVRRVAGDILPGERHRRSRDRSGRARCR